MLQQGIGQSEVSNHAYCSKLLEFLASPILVEPMSFSYSDCTNHEIRQLVCPEDYEKRVSRTKMLKEAKKTKRSTTQASQTNEEKEMTSEEDVAVTFSAPTRSTSEPNPNPNPNPKPAIDEGMSREAQLHEIVSEKKDSISLQKQKAANVNNNNDEIAHTMQRESSTRCDKPIEPEKRLAHESLIGSQTQLSTCSSQKSDTTHYYLDPRHWLVPPNCDGRVAPSKHMGATEFANSGTSTYTNESVGSTRFDTSCRQLRPSFVFETITHNDTGDSNATDDVHDSRSTHSPLADQNAWVDQDKYNQMIENEVMIANQLFSKEIDDMLCTTNPICTACLSEGHTFEQCLQNDWTCRYCGKKTTF
ncbi:hypothetical protein RFI_13799 [Reticulomyxa filosa]|uniref:Uncharacterized protein n=1 Tax=Reticulomyxa filosa TaxID=46433 RepID=X6NBZ3_RETFI|nr:hypothetical protein RFI_13799 [Reticulomyxa filosa]|eukprot:ETO23383.1 hypothetical protein RFI_13799 [Reticulomyxa filosa]